MERTAATEPSGRIRRLLELPIHPFLFTAYAILFLWAQNVLKVRSADVLVPLVQALGGTALVFGVLWLVLRSAWRAAIVASVFSFLFFSFGHLVRAPKAAGEVGSAAPHEGTWLVVWALVAVAAVVLVAVRKPSGKRAAFVLNLVLAVLVVMSMATIVNQKLTGRRAAAAAAARANGTPAAGTPEPPASKTVSYGEPKRDIYYVVFEDTPGTPGLKRFFDYDSTGFDRQLRERGFYVASRPVAPYPKTVHMLSATLNMDYLSNDRFPKDSGDWRLAYNSVKNPKIAQLLRDRGYRYNVFGSGYFVVRHDDSADENPVYEPGAGLVHTEFDQVLYDSTVLAAIASRYHVGTLDERYKRYQEVLFWEQKVAEVAHDPAPTFTFAHLETTHNPFVFDRNGRFLTLERAQKMSKRDLYLESVRYAHKELVSLVDKINGAYPEDRRPIIIIQTDEGPGPVGWNPNTKEHYDWTKAPQDSLDEKFSIFAAFSFPGVEDVAYSPTMSPVNTFRLLLDTYFGGDYPMLPERSYIYPNERHPYEFIDVTDRVNH